MSDVIASYFWYLYENTYQLWQSQTFYLSIATAALRSQLQDIYLHMMWDYIYFLISIKPVFSDWKKLYDKEVKNVF